MQASKEDKEYLPITGLASFNSEAIKLAYGAECAPLKEGRVSAGMLAFRCRAGPGPVTAHPASQHRLTSVSPM